MSVVIGRAFQGQGRQCTKPCSLMLSYFLNSTCDGHSIFHCILVLFSRCDIVLSEYIVRDGMSTTFQDDGKCPLSALDFLVALSDLEQRVRTSILPFEVNVKMYTPSCVTWFGIALHP